MSNIGGFGQTGNIYHNSIMFNRLGQKQMIQQISQEQAQTQPVEKAAQQQQVKLSEKAQSYLEELKKKYGNMDFIVADYDTEEEADRILSASDSTKEFSVLIDPETLEKMASDEETRNANENLLKNAKEQITNLMEHLGPDAELVEKIGMSIDKEGKVSYFAELSSMNKKTNEWLEQTRENRRTERKKQEEDRKEALTLAKEERTKELERYTKPQEADKVVRAKADSIETLGDYIKNATQSIQKWQTENARQPGYRFDYSV